MELGLVGSYTHQLVYLHSCTLVLGDTGKEVKCPMSFVEEGLCTCLYAIKHNHVIVVELRAI